MAMTINVRQRPTLSPSWLRIGLQRIDEFFRLQGELSEGL